MRTNTYFLSDLHLGTHSVSPAERLDRERRVVRWLDTVKDDASVIYLLGDILDYWYVHKSPCLVSLGRYTAYLAHGDGLGRTPFSFRIIRSVFHSRICQILYSAIHPRWTVAFAHRWSSHSRKHGNDLPYQGEENEFLVRYAKEYRRENPSPHIDFFIFGHRHILLDLMIARDCRVLILGDWIQHFSYARFDGEQLFLEQYIEGDSQ